MSLDKQIEGMVNSLKGIQGTGRMLGAISVLLKELNANITLEPGDFARSGDANFRISAPIAYDLWYLFNDVNLVHHIDPHTDSEEYVSENLKFLEEKLMGLKPMKAVTPEDMKNYAVETNELGETSFRRIQDNWSNEGAYFIQVMVYEMLQNGTALQFKSTGPAGAKVEDFVGHLTFPVGQLGVMEVVSMFQETELEVKNFTLQDDKKPTIIGEDDLQMFPPFEHNGENRSFGKHLVNQKGYLIPEEVSGVMELMADCTIGEKDYTQEVKPKSWSRLWIKKYDKFPVPGEFIGILCKPMSVPPHVWWFQESTPFLYSGNWVETQNLTSGVITQVTPEAARTDGGVGDEYWVKVNGIEFIAYASDFKSYVKDDRVAVLKRWTTGSKATKSFTWKDQRDGTHPVKDQVSLEFMILPVTFYKEN